MKITEQQFLILLETLSNSLKVFDGGQVFSYDEKVRRDILNEIINQQKEEIEVE